MLYLFIVSHLLEFVLCSNHQFNKTADSLKLAQSRNYTNSNNFGIIGFNIAYNPTYIPNISCDYGTSCISLLCNTLQNTSLCLAYIGLFPTIKTFNCPMLPSISGATIIFYILYERVTTIQPTACYTVGDCFMRACKMYKSYQNPVGIIFTGQCSP